MNKEHLGYCPVKGCRTERARFQETCRKHAPTESISLAQGEIAVNRQALLDVVRALDIGAKIAGLPASLDRLREPLFVDEISSGKARDDFSMNTYQ